MIIQKVTTTFDDEELYCQGWIRGWNAHYFTEHPEKKKQEPTDEEKLRKIVYEVAGIIDDLIEALGGEE